MIRLYRLLCWVLLVSAVCCAGACSVLDGGDEAKLEELLNALSEDTEIRVETDVVKQRALEALHKRNGGDSVGFVECQGRDEKGKFTGEWFDRGADANKATVADILSCLKSGIMGVKLWMSPADVFYSTCLNHVLNDAKNLEIKDLETIAANPNATHQIPLSHYGWDSADTKFNCRYTVLPEFEPDTIEAPGSEEHARMSAKILIQLILGLETAPAIFGSAELADILVVVCALGGQDRHWGCPGGASPNDDVTFAPGMSSGGDP